MTREVLDHLRVHGDGCTPNFSPINELTVTGFFQENSLFLREPFVKWRIDGKFVFQAPWETRP